MLRFLQSGVSCAVYIAPTQTHSWIDCFRSIQCLQFSGNSLLVPGFEPAVAAISQLSRGEKYVWPNAIGPKKWSQVNHERERSWNLKLKPRQATTCFFPCFFHLTVMPSNAPEKHSWFLNGPAPQVPSWREAAVTTPEGAGSGGSRWGRWVGENLGVESTFNGSAVSWNDSMVLHGPHGLLVQFPFGLCTSLLLGWYQQLVHLDFPLNHVFTIFMSGYPLVI